MKTPSCILLILLMLLTACASPEYTEPALSSDHPANPSAIESAAPPRSRTLDLAAAEQITGQPASSLAVDSPPHSHDAPSSGSADVGTLYICPMHPEVTSNKPDLRCPKCGMKLRKGQMGGNP